MGMDMLAGVICGLVMGTVLLGVGVYFVFKNRDIYDHLSGLLPKGISPTMVMLGFVIGLPPVWALLGIIAGLIYNVIGGSDPEAGLGSSNYIFTVIMLCLSGFTMLLVLLIRRRILWQGLIISVSFAGIFGWLLPLLANWR